MSWRIRKSLSPGTSPAGEPKTSVSGALSGTAIPILLISGIALLILVTKRGWHLAPLNPPFPPV